MKKHKRIFISLVAFALLLASAFAFVSCKSNVPVDGIPDRTEDAANRIGNFEQGESANFYSANGYSNGGIFNCTWYRSNVSYDGGSMKIKFDYDSAKNQYTSGEVRSNQNYGYGYYSVCMKPMNKSGMVSSFFTYTGKGEGNPHDEIDIEFLGKDMTIVQFNYHTGGAGGNEHTYKLGFDASDDFHVYGFDWRENQITWFIDGKAVYAADKNIPTTPGKIMMNLWNPTGIGQSMWVGSFDGKSGIPGNSEYRWVAYTSD